MGTATTAATTPDRRTSSDNTFENESAPTIERALKALELEGEPHTKEQQVPQDDEKPQTAVSESPSVVSATLQPPPSSIAPQDVAVTAAEPEAGRTKLETFLVMLALCMALFLAALDMTIVATAIPTISNHFHSSAGYVWIGSAYLLGNAAFVPIWGKLSDIFGRKPVLICTVAVFWVGSLLCALSVSMGMLIAARAIQGVGAGGAIALPNICISDLFSMRKRGMYFGMLGVVWALAGAIGPILGGVFTTKASWRWCFYINLPISGLAIVILIFVLKLHNPRTPMKQGLAAIDLVGSVLVIGGTLMLLFGLEFGGVQFPWKSAAVICLLVFGCVTLGIFGLWQSFGAKYPLMPARLFGHRTNVAAFALSITHAITFMSGSYWLPLYFQTVLGASSLLSGVYLLPYALALSLTSAMVGVIIKKTGVYKVPIMAGLFVMTLGFGLFIDLGPKANWAKIILFQIVAGIGVGPNFQAPLIAIQTNTAPRDIGSATATFQFLRQLGTSTSVVIGGVILNNQMQRQQPRLIRELGEQIAINFNGKNAASNVFLVKHLPEAARTIVRDAYWDSLQKMYIVYTCFAFAGFLISFFIKQKSLSKDHQEHKTGLQSLKAERGSKAVDEEKAVPIVTAPEKM